MSLLSKLGGNLIAEKIKNEIQKILDEKISSAVINSMFPQPKENDLSAHVDVHACLNVEIETLCIRYTAHLGKDSDESLSFPAKTYPLILQSRVPVKRPAAMAQSQVIHGERIDLKLSGIIHGFEFQQMMMGMGATIHAADFRISVAGELDGTWVMPPEAELETEVKAEAETETSVLSSNCQ